MTVSRNALGEFFISFSCAEVWPCDPLPKTGKTAGMDRGLKDFGTLQSGERIKAPEPLKKALSEIQRLGHALSRKVKGSNGRKKARLALARAHKHVANVRREWHHRTARDLVRRFDRITIEDLSLRGMCKLWGRKVTDLGLGDFAITLEHHAHKAGKIVAKYPRFSRSTGVCPSCRAEHKLQLWERSFECCAKTWDRDQAAAIILDEAGCGLGQPALVTAGSQLEKVGPVHAESHALSRGSASTRYVA